MAIAEAEIEAQLHPSKIQPGMKMTEEELMHLPDDGFLYELVDGFAVGKPWATVYAGAIAVNAIGLLGPFARGRGAMSAGKGGFRMKNGNIRVPATSFTRKERIPGGKPSHSFGTVAPDLCIEIISPSEKQTDMERKVRDYFDSGTVQVWHLFPETQQVRVYTSPTETQMLNSEDTLTAKAILPGFSCRVSDIFTKE